MSLCTLNSIGFTLVQWLSWEIVILVLCSVKCTFVYQCFYQVIQFYQPFIEIQNSEQYMLLGMLIWHIECSGYVVGVFELIQHCSKCTNYSAIGEALVILLCSSHTCDTSLYTSFNFANYLHAYKKKSTV